MAMTRKLWSINALATELDIDRRTLAKRLTGLPPATEKKVGSRIEKRWHLADVLEHFNNPRSPDGEVLNLEAERARLAAEQADKVALENAIRRSEYAPIEALQFAIADVAGQMKSIFEGIPKKLKNSLPALRAREIKILERELVKIQNAAASIQVNFDDIITND